MIRKSVHSHGYRKVIEVVQELIKTSKFLERNANSKIRVYLYSVQILIISVNI